MLRKALLLSLTLLGSIALTARAEVKTEEIDSISSSIDTARLTARRRSSTAGGTGRIISDRIMTTTTGSSTS